MGITNISENLDPSEADSRRITSDAIAWIDEYESLSECTLSEESPKLYDHIKAYLEKDDPWFHAAAVALLYRFKKFQIGDALRNMSYSDELVISYEEQKEVEDSRVQSLEEKQWANNLSASDIELIKGNLLIEMNRHADIAYELWEDFKPDDLDWQNKVYDCCLFISEANAVWDLIDEFYGMIDPCGDRSMLEESITSLWLIIERVFEYTPKVSRFTIDDELLDDYYHYISFDEGGGVPTWIEPFYGKDKFYDLGIMNPEEKVYKSELTEVLFSNNRTFYQYFDEGTEYGLSRVVPQDEYRRTDLRRKVDLLCEKTGLALGYLEEDYRKANRHLVASKNFQSFDASAYAEEELPEDLRLGFEVLYVFDKLREIDVLAKSPEEFDLHLVSFEKELHEVLFRYLDKEIAEEIYILVTNLLGNVLRDLSKELSTDHFNIIGQKKAVNMAHKLSESFEEVRNNLSVNAISLEGGEDVQIKSAEQFRLQVRTLKLIGNAMEVIGEKHFLENVDPSTCSYQIECLLADLRDLEPEYLDRVVTKNCQSLDPILSELADIAKATHDSAYWRLLI
jgi:hypothetical protein